MKTNEVRIFSIKEQIKNIYRGSKGFVLLRTSRKTRLMNKILKEEIMLAITEVNGCAMCSYMHTNFALQAGMSREKIQEILNGDTSHVKLGNAVAVIFGQHYAANKEYPLQEAINRIVNEYGPQKAELIIAACCVITMTNGMGIGLDLLWSRIRFNRNKESNILSEILNPLLTMVLFPVFTIFNLGRRLFNKVRLFPKQIQTMSV